MTHERRSDPDDATQEFSVEDVPTQSEGAEDARTDEALPDSEGTSPEDGGDPNDGV